MFVSVVFMYLISYASFETASMSEWVRDAHHMQHMCICFWMNEIRRCKKRRNKKCIKKWEMRRNLEWMDGRSGSKERDERHMFEWNRKFIHEKSMFIVVKKCIHKSAFVPWFFFSSFLSRISSTLNSIEGFTHLIHSCLFFLYLKVVEKGANGIWYSLLLLLLLILSTSCPIYTHLYPHINLWMNFVVPINEFIHYEYRIWIHNRCNFHKNLISFTVDISMLYWKFI